MSMQRKLVAIVEDDPSMLKSTERLLNVYGYATASFTSAESFLDSEAQRGAICLVLDIHLGGISGIELRRQLTASGSRLPIVFMTAVHDEATEREAMEAGCIAYLHKPFRANLLIDAVRMAAG